MSIKAAAVSGLPVLMYNLVMIAFADLSFAELSEWLSREGFKAGHARSIWNRFYRSQNAGLQTELSLPGGLEERLTDSFDFSYTLRMDEHLQSRDGASKFLFRSRDEQIIETVFIPQGRRSTLCVSCQAGCPWGCRFCATGAMGFKRDLRSAEIVSQVMQARSFLDKSITNLVFMGMGEPLSNLENVEKSLSILSHSAGLAFPPRRITVSTVGILKGLERVIENRWIFPLAVSLHHHDSHKREQLMPGTAQNGLVELMTVLKHYTRELKRPVFFEYLMLGGVNDSLDDASALLGLIGGIPCRLNLIHFHPFPGSSYQPSSPQAEEAFYRFFQQTSIPVIFRKSRGEDIRAACGQLAGRLESD